MLDVRHKERPVCIVGLWYDLKTQPVVPGMIGSNVSERGSRSVLTWALESYDTWRLEVTRVLKLKKIDAENDRRIFIR